MTQGANVQIEQTAEALRILLGNAAEVEFALDGERLLGVGAVRQGGVLLRNPAARWKPFFYTPEGVHYAEFRLKRAGETTGA